MKIVRFGGCWFDGLFSLLNLSGIFSSDSDSESLSFSSSDEEEEDDEEEEEEEELPWPDEESSLLFHRRRVIIIISLSRASS